MNTLSSFEQLNSELQAFRECTEYDIVLHGTPRVTHVGDVIEPSISRRPARRDNAALDIRWGELEPYAFATYPEYPDVATFTATVMGIAPPYTAGIREENEPSPLVFMANSDVKEDTKRRNPIGTICALPSEAFRTMPHLPNPGIEVVSTESVSVIGAWAVRYSVLSFALDGLPPLSIPGMSDEELAFLAASEAPERSRVN